MTSLIALVDTDPVPPSLDMLVSAKRFGDIVFRQKRLIEHTVLALSQIKDVTVAVFSEDTSTKDVLRRHAHCDRVIQIPSWLAPVDLTGCADRIERLTLLDEPCIARLDGLAVPMISAPMGLYVDQPEMMGATVGVMSNLIPRSMPIDIGNGFVDLREPVGMLDYLSGAFSARYFNSVERSRFHVTKSSTKIAKIKAEHDFYHLVPPQMQRWLVMPFDLKIDSQSASYTMERLLTLDMAQQWINGAISPLEFERFLEDMSGFFASRPRRTCSRARAQQNFDQTYIDKVRDRVATLKTLPMAKNLGDMIRIGTGYGSLDELVSAYLDLASGERRHLTDHEVIGHGDPCFSNILYDKRIRLLKLIDPRGAETEADLWTDPLYDYAKLSHSVLGGYDFVVNGMCDASFDLDLTLRLKTYESNWQEYGALFTDHLAREGINPRQIRIREASLFLSMLPLHVDVPRNVLSFVVIAAHILNEVRKQ